MSHSENIKAESVSKIVYESRTCKFCGNVFIVKKTSKKQYCCTGCGNLSRKRQVEKKCLICGSVFSVIKKRENTAKYCSRKCAFEAKRADNNVVCTTCGKPFHKKESHIRKLKHGSFCSRKCLNIWKQTAYSGEGNHQYGLNGALNASFKGEEIKCRNAKQIDDLIYMPEHPRATQTGRVRKYIVVVEQNFERFDQKYFYFDGKNHYLKKGVVVHHKDQNHNNNDIENLMPLTIGEHTKIHRELGAFDFIGRDKLGRFYNKTAVSKQGELLENPEEDNQQPSIGSNAFEGSTTNSRVLPDKAEDGNADTSALPVFTKTVKI